MSAIIGQRVTDTAISEQSMLPRNVKARARFWFMVHPHCWSFDGGEWLPTPSKLHLDPGCNGVTEGGGTDLAVAQANRNGWQVIRPNDARLGDYKWYVQEVPKQGRGRVYLSIWDEASIVGGQVFWDHDDEGWRDFRRHLVDAGICPPMSKQVYQLETHKQQSRVERLEGSAATAPHNMVVAGRLKRETERLEAMMAAQPKHLSDAPKKRKRVRGKRLQEEASP